MFNDNEVLAGSPSLRFNGRVGFKAGLIATAFMIGTLLFVTFLTPFGGFLVMGLDSPHSIFNTNFALAITLTVLALFGYAIISILLSFLYACWIAPLPRMYRQLKGLLFGTLFAATSTSVIVLLTGDFPNSFSTFMEEAFIVLLLLWPFHAVYGIVLSLMYPKIKSNEEQTPPPLPPHGR